MAEAQVVSGAAEGELNLALEHLRFKAILKGFPPREIPKAGIKRRWEILALAENNGWIGLSRVERAVDFWIWCGLKPERWSLVPDQRLWEEFSKECGLYKYKDHPDARTQALPDLSTWMPPTLGVSGRPE
ncbi:uncharacterized protein N7498_009501 [Penicillium cinerascens]|uniref:Uncharacterized protein n=1 Tax=Penicillium cinerascens TaxID=70096 RepID=A0A9W9JA31_9EURO|nr:uncharacterized protein N7498_009501 [Penicillium cinerascens]KAJ5190516.1 hypothetical protein N7498_009501 [Penicillium cinerascens]